MLSGQKCDSAELRHDVIFLEADSGILAKSGRSAASFLEPAWVQPPRDELHSPLYEVATFFSNGNVLGYI